MFINFFILSLVVVIGVLFIWLMKKAGENDLEEAKFIHGNYAEIQCPVCGYYCLGKGGHGCIDKPKLNKL